MKILIVSDTHGLGQEVSALKNRWKDQVDACIHCGDSELPSDSPVMKDFLAVAGNCDFPGAYPAQLLRKIGSLNFLIVHGHLFDVKNSPDRLIQQGKKLGAQVICHGHTHLAGCRKKDGILVINPGSLRFPRNYREGTYVVLEQNDRSLVVRYYTDANEPVKKFTKIYS